MEKQDFQSPLSITLAPRTGVRFPTAKSGICPRRPTEAWSGGRPRPDTSFKWGLKTGHFYRFIRTFRTSWAAGGGQRWVIIHFIRMLQVCCRHQPELSLTRQKKRTLCFTLTFWRL